jgi:ketosteroid isomerase-like protein
MTTPEELAAQAHCCDVVLRAAEAVDDGDAQAFAALFAPDGVLVRPDGSHLQGRAAIAQAYASRDPDRLTQHLICNHRVTVNLAAGTAESHCKVLLWCGRRSAEASAKGRPADAMQQVGEMHDQLQREPHGWFIRKRIARFILYRS